MAEKETATKDKVAAAQKKINTIKNGERPKTAEGGLIYDQSEKVRVSIKYPANWSRPKHLKEEDVVVHPLVALNYIENGFAELVEVVVPFKLDKEKDNR